MSDKAKVILILAVLVVVLGGLTAYDSMKDYLHNNPDGMEGNTAGNLYNGGYVCQLENRVFFANAFDGNKLYVMNVDETEIQKIGNVAVSNINADDKYIYYYVDDIATPSGMGGFTTQMVGIFRADHKGNHAKTLDRTPCGVVKLIGNSLYYERKVQGGETTLYAYDIRSKENGQAADNDINPASSYGNAIYYQNTEDNHYLFRFDLASGSSNLVYEGNVWRPDMQGEYVYFVSLDTEYHLCRYDTVSKEVQTLTTDRVDQYLVCGNYIFYQTVDETAPALKVMNADGSNPQVLAEGTYTGICATSANVYFTEYGSNIMYKVPLTGGSMQPVVFEGARNAALEQME